MVGNYLNYALNYSSDLSKEGFESALVHFRRKHLMEILRSYNSQSIVEVGCGTVPIFSWFSECKKIQIIERSREFCELASSMLIRRRKENDKYEKIDITIRNISFESCFDLGAQIDFVILSSILHEVDNAEIFLKHLKNLLKGDEFIYINVPNANSLHRLLARQAGIIKDTAEISKRGAFFETKRVFEAKELAALVNLCGFDIIDSGTAVLKPFTHAQMDKIFDRNTESNEALLDALFDSDAIVPGLGSEIWMIVKPNSQGQV